MALIIPISCRDGVVILATHHIFGEEWGLNLQMENDEYKHFEMTSDINSIIWKQILTSFAGGDATIRAKFDNTPGARLPTDKLVWLNGSGTGYIGYTATIGFLVGYTIINIRPASNTANPGSTMFDFDLKITGCIYTNNGP